MKQQGIISDFIFQVFALIISVIVVHAVYVAVIRPNADSIMEQQIVFQEADPEYVAERSLYVVMRDYEQETCIILMFWAMSIIGLKIYRNRKENRLLQRPLLNLSEGMSILRAITHDLSRRSRLKNGNICCPGRCWPPCIDLVQPAASRTWRL